MAAKTLADLIEEVADALGHYKQGTADATSDTDEIVDAEGLYEPDDYWVGHYAYILTDAGGASAAPEGEERPVTDYDQSAATLTVSPAFTAAVGNGDTYELMPLPRSAIKRAINRAIGHADRWFKTVTDTTTITLDTDDYDYALPSDVIHLVQVWLRDDTDDPWREVSPQMWRVSGEPGSMVLYFDAFEGMDDGYTVRLEYTAYLDTLDSDSDGLGVGEAAERSCVDFIVNYALYWLYAKMSAAAPQSDAFRSYLTLAEYRRDAANEIRERTGRHLPAGRIHGRRLGRSRG